MKNFLHIFAAAAIGISASAQHAGEGTRLDYINSEGERTRSLFLDTPDNFLFSIYQQDENFYVSSGDGSSIKVTPWGTEKYTVVCSSDQDIKTSLVILSDEDTRTRGEGEAIEVLCGAKMRLAVSVPEGTFPVVTLSGAYSEWPYRYDSFTPAISNALANQALYFVSPAKKAELLDILSARNGFVKSDLSDTWYIDLEMPNEPLTITASCLTPDSETLRDYCYTVCRSLYRVEPQLYNSGFQDANGEPFLTNTIGNMLSDDFVSNLYGRIGQMDMITSAASWYNWITWLQAYGYIGRSNLLLSQLDEFSVSKDDKDFAEAILLTMRAHGYWRLLQYYAPRWSDSANGSVSCLPLETIFTTDYLPASTMKEIIDLCYSDLDKAIDTFSRLNYPRLDIVEPDLNVAKATKMRIALLCEDWATAAKESSDILSTASLTSNEELTSGLFNPSDSWLWGAWNNGKEGNSVYYASFQCTNACNGVYPASWGIGTNAISRRLFLSMKPDDIRRNLFLMPETLQQSVLKNVSAWYSNRYFVPGAYGIIYLIAHNLDDTVIDIYSSLRPDGVEYGAFTNGYSGHAAIQFGAQTKFYVPGENILTDAAVIFLRTEEVLLSHAEAAAQAGQTAEAINDLRRLNSMRIENYDESELESGDILELIRNARSIELWGEGHSWYDKKRWNVPLLYQEWIEGDIESGNMIDRFTERVEPDFANGWRGLPPANPYYNNPDLNPERLGYKAVRANSKPKQSPSRKQRNIKEPIPLMQLYPIVE